MQQQRAAAGPTGMNNFLSMNLGAFAGQGVKRMRNDDFRADGVSAPHRIKWDSNDEEKSLNFIERNDIDQRSEFVVKQKKKYFQRFSLLL